MPFIGCASLLVERKKNLVSGFVVLALPEPRWWWWWWWWWCALDSIQSAPPPPSDSQSDCLPLINRQKDRKTDKQRERQKDKKQKDRYCSIQTYICAFSQIDRKTCRKTLICSTCNRRAINIRRRKDRHYILKQT